MKGLTKLTLSGAACAAILFSGCGSSTTTSSDSTDLTAMTAADPYISNARFYVDSTPNGKYDAGEAQSSLTDINGTMTWSSAVPVGSIIRMNPKYRGTHNGNEYTGPLLASTVSSSGMITPLTILNSKGLTSTQIKTMLTTCGLTDLPADFDINSDPMSIASSTTLDSNTSLANIRATIAINGMLKIMEGSTILKAMTGAEIYTSATTSGETVNTIFTAMITGVKSGLNQEMMSTLGGANAGLSSAGLPSVPTEVVINTAVTIMDKMVESGYNACNSTNGNKAAIGAAINTRKAAILGQVSNVGQYYYGVYLKRNKHSLSAGQQAGIPANMRNGYQTTGSLSLQDDGTIMAQTPTPTTLVSDWNATTVGNGGLAIDLNNTRGVAYDKKRDVIYIAHDGNIAGGIISKLSPDGNGTAYKSVGKWITGLNRPTSIAVLNDTLYVADYNTTRIFALDDMNMTGNNSASDTNIVDSFVDQDNKHLKDIAVDRGGNIYISVEEQDTLYKFSYDEVDDEYTLDSNAQTPTPTGGLYSLYNLENGFYGNLIIGNTAIRKLTEEAPGIVGLSTGFTNVNSITLYNKDSDDKGLYLVVDNNQTIKAVYETNSSKVSLTNGDMGANQAGDITYIKSKNLLIVPTESNSTIRAFKVQ